MIELIAAIIETIIELISGAIEAIASLFTAGSEALGTGEALLVLGCLFIELILWLLLWIGELGSALLQWRKPKMVNKPVIWRPGKKP